MILGNKYFQSLVRCLDEEEVDYKQAETISLMNKISIYSSIMKASDEDEKLQEFRAYLLQRLVFHFREKGVDYDKTLTNLSILKQELIGENFDDLCEFKDIYGDIVKNISKKDNQLISIILYYDYKAKLVQHRHNIKEKITS